MNKKEYLNKKEYYDYQRMVQYNRELITLALGEEHKEIFEDVWANIPFENYVNPPQKWRPIDRKYWIPNDFTKLTYISSKEILESNLHNLPTLPIKKPKLIQVIYE